MSDTVKTITIKIDGEDALVDINEINDALKETNVETQELQGTNLSNFSGQLSDLTTKFKAGEIGVKGLAKGVITMGKALLTAFITNPILLAITAIVAIVIALYNVFKNFKPLVNALERAFAGLSAAFAVLKDGLLAFLSGNKSLKESFDGLGAAMKQAAIEAAALKQAQIDLEDSALALAVQNAEVETSIARLIIQSKDRTKTEEERLKKLQEALDLEKDQHEKNIKYADEAERIAFRQMTIHLRLSEQELELLRKKGIAGLRELQNTKDINDDEIESYADLLIQKQALTKKSLQLTEQSELEINQILAEGAAKRQAATDKEIDAAEKKADAEKLVIDALLQTKINNGKREQDLVEAQLERLAVIRKADTDERLKQIKAEFDAVDNTYAIAEKRYEKDSDEYRDAYLAKLDADKKYYTDKDQLEKDNLVESIKFREDFLDKYTRLEHERLVEVFNTANVETDEGMLIRAKANEDILQLTHEHNLAKEKLTIERAEAELEIEKRISEEKQEYLLTEYDAEADLTMRSLKNEELTADEVLSIYQSLQDRLWEAREKGLISEEEYYKTKIDLAENEAARLEQIEQRRKDLNAQKLQAGLDTINTLAQADKAATQTAINLQQRKLDNGEISQEEYDKKVAEIQLKAAKREKAYAVAAAIINTAQGISKALASVPPPLSFVLAAATGVLGAAQIAAILSTPIGGASTASVPSIGAVDTGESSTAPNTSFSFSPVATEPTSQPVKTYVIGKDVNTQTQLDRAIIANGTIG